MCLFGGTLNLAQSTNRNKKNVNLTSLTAVCINTPPSSLAVAVVSPQSQPHRRRVASRERSRRDVLCANKLATYCRTRRTRHSTEASVLFGRQRRQHLRPTAAVPRILLTTVEPNGAYGLACVEHLGTKHLIVVGSRETRQRQCHSPEMFIKFLWTLHCVILLIIIILIVRYYYY